MSFFGLTFSAPGVLAALALLPAIWFLLRLTPPLPKKVVFPPLFLLKGLSATDETPAGTPWWLMALRLAAAGAVIVALAGPQTGRTLTLPGKGPLVLFVDNGWPAASHWRERQALMDEAVRRAEAERRPVLLVATAERPKTDLLDAGEAAKAAAALKPESRLADRGRALSALAKANLKDAEVLWLSDGLDDGETETVVRGLKKLGSLRLFRDPAAAMPLAAVEAADGIDGFAATVLRAGAKGRRAGVLSARGADGAVLASAPFAFAPGENRASVRLTMPLAMRNKTAELRIEGERSAGAVFLFDRGAPRRAVGLAAAPGGSGEPLLAGSYYLERALSPYADVTKAPLAALIDRHVPILVTPGALSAADRERAGKFVAAGGVLIRFADEALAEGGDDLVPVPLRRGGRFMGGALSWAAPQHPAPFPAAGPFAGLPIPGEVTVSRQILAEPSVALSQHTWARLADGTPMVTAARRGKGWVVLFHVTASPAWSNLPLSGLFVSMLRRLLPLAEGGSPAAEAASAVLPPVETLDGFGRLAPAGAEAQPLVAAKFDATEPSAVHPPGLYGTPGALRALNAARADTALLPMTIPGEGYGQAGSIDLAPLLLVFAGLLLLVDFAASLALRGLMPNPKRLIRVLFPALVAILLLPPAAKANDAFAMKAALSTHLAYVETGVAETDAVSRAGLVGLSRYLAARTAYDPPEPMGVNLETDDLSFFPLIYWPMEPREKDLSAKALAKLSDYMRSGGTLLVDTRDLTIGTTRDAAGAGQRTLRRLLGRLDLPPLERVGPNHVLNRAFYLLNGYPGRWDGGALWVEAEAPGDAGRAGDGVSPIILGGNDWAAAWAVDGRGRFLADVSPGGERQREMAFRFGINVVMYALTGNYKTDQIHVPTILKRLGK